MESVFSSQNWLSSQRLVVICVISCDDRSLTLWLGYHCLLQDPDFAETLKHQTLTQRHKYRPGCRLNLTKFDPEIAVNLRGQIVT
jgi:hypothetical protein